MTLLLIVTFGSVLLAAVMTAIAWRVTGRERQRSDARVAALAAEIHGVSYSDSPVPADLGYDSNAAARFAASPGRSGFRLVTGAAAAAIVIVAAISAALLAGSRTSAPARGANAAPAAAPSAPPLELVALTHERAGDQLTVRGVIHNPASGARMDGLTVVVFLFTPDGGFLSSGRAAIAAGALDAGREASFAVTVPGAAEVGRYRVSFRVDDRSVPHLDLRHEG